MKAINSDQGLIYIWASMWEIECCQPEATVGDPWRAFLFFRAGNDPDFAAEGFVGAMGSALFGTVELSDVRKIEDFNDELVVAEAHGVTFMISTDEFATKLVGHLFLDRHGGYMDDFETGESPRRFESTLVVESVYLLPIEYRAEGRVHYPQRYMPPVSVNSSSDRDRYDSYEDGISHVLIAARVP